MSTSRRVAALTELLARVRRNAGIPRPARALTSSVGGQLPAEDLKGEDVDLVTVPPPAPAAGGPTPRHDLDEPDAAARSGVIPLEAGLEIDGDVELESGELIDVTDLSPEEVATIEAEAAEDVAAELPDEAAPPSSSRRPRLADEAELTESGADPQEREVPLHTPPPESGRQVTAPVQIPAHGAPPRDLLEVGDELSARHPGPGPTPEQLGETIELDEPLGGDLELDEASEAPTPPPPPRDDLEHELPRGSPAAYDSSLELPSSAAEDLVRHRVRERARGEAVAAPVVAAPTAVVERPVLHARPAEIKGTVPRAEPRSFLELLDDSLAL